MEIQITKREDLTKNSLAFLKKYAQVVSVDEEIIIAGFLNRQNVDENFIFEDGEIVHLDLGRCTYSCSNELKKWTREKGEAHENELEINLPAIDKVDLSDLKNLKTLEYKYNNYRYNDTEVKVEFISFKDLKKLETLHLDGHLIGEIDISACEKLTKLICSKSSMTKLDYAHNVNLEYLDCSKNNITTLDLRNNKKLTSLISFSNPLTEILFCEEYLENPGNNPLEKLQLSGAQFEIRFELLPNLKSLTYFSPLEHKLDFSRNNALKKIDINYNARAESIDVSNCPKLIELDINNMKKFNAEVICNEKQSFLVPSLSKLNKTKPNPKQKEYLKTFSLHQKAMDQEPGNGFYELEKILKNKSCDIATALMIYWTGNPHYYSRFKDLDELKSGADAIHSDGFEEMTFVKNRILKGEYKINLIPFDPANFNGHDLTKNPYEDVKPVHEIPEEFKKAVPGENVDGFDEAKKVVLTVKGWRT